ncbi:uncharacterized protein B0I36DRAFT_368148 [Microdochium trichocladiopsis]|uniref:Mid2 domain-containing protein n=1 Tax=Microdochium trichocladiopsis TaxID=1682393 RepID=A0A9P8XUE6_9PEZI|nr:uncharacterized protein B0I36DRAFT_368148 [Microdochium trichocladiopsis]KAH7018101.1 hypothetical protein B0I36DRAFT_368148 [Microdochium trichocladiopsis]
MVSSTRNKSLLGLVGILGLLGAVEADNKVLYPAAEGMTFYQGDSVAVRYVTDYADPKLNIFCYDDVAGSGVINKLETAITVGTGTKTVVLNMDGVSGCWFNLQNANNIWGVNSPIWTFKQSRPVQTTTQPPAAPPPAAATTTKGTTTVVPPAQTTSPADEASPPPAQAQAETSPATTADSSPTTTPIAETSDVDSLAVNSSSTTADPATKTAVTSTSTGHLSNPTDPAAIPGSSGSNNNNNNNNSSSGSSSGSTGASNGGGSSGGNGSGGGDTRDGGLSDGAKAGIGAGVGVSAALAIAGLVFFLMARRRQRPSYGANELPAEDYPTSTFISQQGQQLQQQNYQNDLAKRQSRGGSSGWTAPSPQEFYAKPEQYGGGPYEMHTGVQPPELPTLERPQEVLSPGMFPYNQPPEAVPSSTVLSYNQHPDVAPTATMFPSNHQGSKW